MALLNPQNFRKLVAIGLRDRKKIFCCHATGFLIGFISKNSKDVTKRRYYIFLATNRHVFEDKKYVELRLNTIDGKTKIFEQGLIFSNGENRWLAHRNKKIDLALLNVSPQVLQEHKVIYGFFPQETFAYYRNFQKIGIAAGDDLYVLGFPMGIAGEIQNCACVKMGIISRIDQEIMRESKAFLIDSSIFPGNSGSPVIFKPTMTSLEGTKAINQAYLLGIVSRYLPYEEQLYTHQTNPPTVVSLERENSGLSFVVPVDFAHQIFNHWIVTKKQLEKAQKQIENQPAQGIKASL